MKGFFMKYKHKKCCEGYCDKPRKKRETPITHYIRCEEHHKRFLEYAKKSRKKRDDRRNNTYYKIELKNGEFGYLKNLTDEEVKELKKSINKTNI